MELFKEILVEILKDQKIEIAFPNLQIAPSQLVEMRCYTALKQIKSIIEDISLKDDTCFMKIEEIIKTLEDLGSDGGFRHDFG